MTDQAARASTWDTSLEDACVDFHRILNPSAPAAPPGSLPRSFPASLSLLQEPMAKQLKITDRAAEGPLEKQALGEGQINTRATRSPWLLWAASPSAWPRPTAVAVEAAAHTSPDQSMGRGRSGLSLIIFGSCRFWTPAPDKTWGSVSSVRGHSWGCEQRLWGSASPSRSEQGVQTRLDQQPEPFRPCALFQEQSPGQL